jgi:cell division protein FtsI (penicillin-binding protein 3)
MAGRSGYLALSGAPDEGAKIVTTQAAPKVLRAEILDRNGELLATSVETSSLWVKSEPRSGMRAKCMPVS